MHWGLGLPAGLTAAAAPMRWFAFIARRSGRMTASTCTPYAGDTHVTAYEGSVPGQLAHLADNDDTPLRCDRAGASYVGFPVAAGRPYRLAVRLASGSADGAETLVLGWDDTPPDASVDVGPSGVVPERSAAFAWSTTASDAVAFECSLDGHGFAACPPAYGGLADGPHAFRVRALDAAGNVGPAAERTWTVEAGAAGAAASRSRKLTVRSESVGGPRAARARGLARAYEGGPLARFAAGRRGTSVLLLALKAPRPGTVVTVACERRGNRCPFARRTVKAGADVARLFRGRRLTAGAVLELKVTRPGTVGRLFRWEMRKRRRPRSAALCLPPGTSRASAC
jgi:hypothetical protein